MPAPLLPPPGWGQDSLTRFLDQVRANQFATYFKLRPLVDKLARLDAALVAFADGRRDPPNGIVALLQVRGVGAFRASVGHAMAGQCVEVYPMARLALECGAYALAILQDKSRADLWIDRHINDKALRACKRAFTGRALKGAVEALAPDLLESYQELYDGAIDFGAHPNERSISGALEIAQIAGGREVRQNLLQGDLPSIAAALGFTGSAGLWLLESYRASDPVRFTTVGLEPELTALRPGIDATPPA